MVTEVCQKAGDEGPVRVRTSFDFAIDLNQGTAAVGFEMRIEGEAILERLIDNKRLALHALYVRFYYVATGYYDLLVFEKLHSGKDDRRQHTKCS